MSEKIYVGSGKERKFQNGGSTIKLFLNLTEIKTKAEQYIGQMKNGNKFIKLEICERRHPDDKGNTHYVVIDTYFHDTQHEDNFQDDDLNSTPF